MFQMLHLHVCGEVSDSFGQGWSADDRANNIPKGLARDTAAPSLNAACGATNAITAPGGNPLPPHTHHHHRHTPPPARGRTEEGGELVLETAALEDIHLGENVEVRHFKQQHGAQALQRARNQLLRLLHKLPAGNSGRETQNPNGENEWRLVKTSGQERRDSPASSMSTRAATSAVASHNLTWASKR